MGGTRLSPLCRPHLANDSNQLDPPKKTHVCRTLSMWNFTNEPFNGSRPSVRGHHVLCLWPAAWAHGVQQCPQPVDSQTVTNTPSTAGRSSSIILHCMSVSSGFAPPRDESSFWQTSYTAAHRDSRQLRYDFSYAVAHPCCASMTAV